MCVVIVLCGQVCTWMNSHRYDDAVGSIHIVCMSILQYVGCYCYGKTEQCDASSQPRTQAPPSFLSPFCTASEGKLGGTWERGQLAAAVELLEIKVWIQNTKQINRNIIKYNIWAFKVFPNYLNSHNHIIHPYYYWSERLVNQDPFVKLRFIDIYDVLNNLVNILLYSLSGELRSCLQITIAAASFQGLSQIVPHCSSWHISTRPSYGVDPPTSLSCPSWHTAKLM